MKKVLLLVGGCLLLVSSTIAQTVSQRLQKAFQQFEADSQLKHAISSLYVIDAKTGEVVFDKNSQIGLAPASTQKIITSVTAFELLGKDYRYKTELGYTGKIENGSIDGNLVLIGNCDPTFGSWRWATTKPDTIFKNFSQSLIKLNIDFIKNSYDYGILHFEDQNIPNGWIWQDVGNYYGAGASALNWRENQFEILLESGSSIGDSVKVVKTNPTLENFSVFSEVKSAAKGTGDNAYAYLPIGLTGIIVRGTIPANEKRFPISATIPYPVSQFSGELFASLLINHRISFGFNKQQYTSVLNGNVIKLRTDYKDIYTHYSPSLDSIIYWFNKKSVNLYGEALIKTFAYEKQGFGSTDSGVAIVKKFWKEKGLDPDELNMADGSGLSPLNRVTTHAQVEILKYAKTKDWFQYFYNSLPLYNGMVMKSGTISDVKGFCGYHKAKDGREYIFSFLVNNYNGKTSAAVNKMYTVLNELK
ncbi:D-alanyl-D-alanine carboxypeptidase/D-alanyl-D-alanine-endopeptidase [Chitinophagaceae bacterium IBVUCB2]|nr:D-alanyl-D-alanine carboxypeptidase/D-alanyl-D-alanine-endopeptidase [Chitinophagaceae bacterium IBVUCB2]